MTLPKRILAPPPAVPTRPDVRFADVVTALSPEGVVRQVSLMQITRVISQLSQLSFYAEEIFSGLITATTATSTRLTNLRTRLDTLKDTLPYVCDKIDNSSITESMNQERFDWKPPATLSTNLFTKDTEDPSVKEAYDACTPPPELGVMDAFRTDGQTCMKFYSYPEFFVEEWKTLMQKELEERKAKRKAKKRAKLQRPTAPQKPLQELQVKRYNSQGELISPAEDANPASSRTMRLLNPIVTANPMDSFVAPLSNRATVSLKPWSTAARTSGGVGQGSNEGLVGGGSTGSLTRHEVEGGEK
ncbi:Wiskott-Aldrich syndrome protein member 1, partial [Borealophlyctis nickersoniae]